MWSLIAAGAIFLASLSVLSRARRFDLAARGALRHANVLRDEIHLILIDNDRLRREGVWHDQAAEVWRARYVIETCGASGGEAKAALMSALAQATRTVPFRQRAH